MTEICARVNGFFNKDIFFVEVTIFTYCTNVCVYVIYTYMFVCKYFPCTPIRMCSYLSLTESVH